MNDLISREDALMCLTGEIKETDTIETIIARFGRRIRKLPPVNVQPNKEDIHREREQAYMCGYEDGSRKYRWETCFECPLSHGCPKIKGCTNEQAIEYASKIPNACPLSAQPERKPCENAISREDALMALTGEWTEPTDELIYRFVKRIKNLPPVNPQPKTGHWIFDEILDKHYYCSECKSMGVDYWDYCPNCGAKMVEPQESEVSNADSD